MKKVRKNILKIIFLTFFSLLLIGFNYIYISSSTNNLIFKQGSVTSKYKYVLFLGTPKHLPNGTVNNFYKNRITTTVDLYIKNKIEKIIISADSLNKYEENEVALIKQDLIKKGVLESDLIYDKKGNRTFFSISNLTPKMRLDTIAIVSQKFHLQRAIYIAKQKHINIVGIEAKGKMSQKLWIRELLARVKMQIDLL